MKVTGSQRVSEPPRGRREGQRKKLLPHLRKAPRRQGPDSSHSGNVTKETASGVGERDGKGGSPTQRLGEGRADTL